MSNPWTKKNPFMSMWLSGANAIGGVARSRITAESKRQSATAMTQGLKAMTDFWSGKLGAAASRRKK